MVVRIIFPVILLTVINYRMLSSGRQGGVSHRWQINNGIKLSYLEAEFSNISVSLFQKTSPPGN